MDFNIKGHYFHELTNVSSNLAYAIDRKYIVSIGFDIKNRPVVTGILGTTGTPPVDQQTINDFLFRIQLTMPEGFHSRNNQDIEWINMALSDLPDRELFDIEGILEPWGGLTIDGEYFDSYTMKIKLKYDFDILPTRCMVSANKQNGILYVFRPYISAKLADSDAGKKLCVYPDDNFNLIDASEEHDIIFTDEFIVLDIYCYDDDGTLRLSSQAIRNDKAKYYISTTLGRYTIIYK